MKDWDFRYDLLPLKDKIFRLAQRITLSREEAEDITQETLIRVWNKREELQEVKSVEAYCLTVCRNLALDRGEKKDNRNLSLEETTCDPADSSCNADECMVRDERLSWVNRLFNQLPDKQRTVMQLRDMEGHSYREIAAIMGISEEQVKVSLFRARQWIRKEYEKIEAYGL